MPALFSKLASTVNKLINEFDLITESRNKLLTDFASYIQEKITSGKAVNLNFICTHNSRRSHISQIWAQAAAYYYGVNNVHTFSGGTGATSFNLRAVKAMREAGFELEAENTEENAIYKVSFADDADAFQVYSKLYDDAANPNKEFAAVMTCSDADENCPYIPGAEKRISLTYNDPKEFDNTPQEEGKYRERVREIGREILYTFSLIKK